MSVVRGEAQFQRRTHDDNGGRASADIWLDAEGAHRLAKALDAVAVAWTVPTPSTAGPIIVTEAHPKVS